MEIGKARKAWEEWRGPIERLDRRLEAAVGALAGSRSDEGVAAEIGLERLPGLYLDPREILRLCRRPVSRFTGSPESPDGREPEPLSNALSLDSRGAALERGLGLSPFVVDVLLLALAVEIDPKYEKIYAFLNDDISRRHPTVGLALAILCGEPAVRIGHCDEFRGGGRLTEFGLIEFVAEDLPFNSRGFRLDEGVFRFLCGDDALAPVLRSYMANEAELPDLEKGPAGAHFGAEASRVLEAARSLQTTGMPVRLVLAGPWGVGKTQVAASVSTRLNSRLISIDAQAWSESPPDQAARLGKALVREAMLRPSVVHLVVNRDPAVALGLVGGDGRAIDPVESEGEGVHRPGRRPPGMAAILETLDRLSPRVPLLMETTLEPERAARASSSRPGGPLIVVTVDTPPVEARRASWETALQGAGLDQEDAGKLATVFGLGPGPIAASVREASLHGGGVSAVWSSARRRAAEGLEGLAERIEPRATWDRLVVPDTARAQLEDLARRVRHRERVLTHWGFAERLSYGTGVSALFAGPPGTGKTLAAEVLAAHLGQLLYRVECSTVISKYIGETEKNLERIFTAASRCDAVLLYDEADALFAKRSDIQDARDRYANQETAYLLQRFERHEKLTILATNFPGNIDPAFPRRLTHTIHFVAPDLEARLSIWRGIWPNGLRLDADIDLKALASRYPVNGANIKNAALGAAYRAADEPGSPSVALRHVEAAMADEYRKLGKPLEEPRMPRRSSGVPTRTQTDAPEPLDLARPR